MNLSAKAREVYDKVSPEDTKRGDIKKIAKAIKKDQALAMELWSTGEFRPRQLAVLIMDKKLITQAFIDELDKDMQSHEYNECNYLWEWLMANQLMKNKKTTALMLTWEKSPSSMQRRTFWYYQARLRWTGKIPIDNGDELLTAIETELMQEAPEVQWAMNFAAGQIGIFEERYRQRSIAIGENTGLYKDEIVPKNCIPNHLPGFISIQVDKMKM